MLCFEEDIFFSLASLRPVVKKIYRRAGESGVHETAHNTKIMQMSCERDDTIVARWPKGDIRELMRIEDNPGFPRI